MSEKINSIKDYRNFLREFTDSSTRDRVTTTIFTNLKEGETSEQIYKKLIEYQNSAIEALENKEYILDIYGAQEEKIPGYTKENYNVNDLNFIFFKQNLLIKSWDDITKSECTIDKDTTCQTYKNNSKLREEVLINIFLIQNHLSQYIIAPNNSLFEFKRRSKKTSRRRSKNTSKRRSKKTSKRRSKKTSKRRSKKTSK